ncbi:MAG: NADH-quinone oxidoreductase subunit C [Terriglobia bacterium]
MLPEALQNHAVAAAFSGLATGGKFELAELTVEVAPENIVAAMTLARHELKFERLSTVTVVDRYPTEPRFEIVYHLHSISRKERLRLKARVSGENPEIDSAVPVYRAADWYEREAYDLFGVRFLNHPDLRRIMMPDDWEGHPLRKDYPVTGPRY